MLSEIHYHGPVVVFDLDDTIFSERTHAIDAYHSVAQMDDIKGAGLTQRAVQVMTRALDKGENPFDALQLLLPGNTTERLNVYRSHTPQHLTPWPDAADVLQRLTAAGVRCGIITDGRSHTQRAKIKALGIERFFHPADILISGETGHDKTQPANFAAIVHHYPEAASFIYVGDNPARDFLVPQRMGWDTYMLRARPGNIHTQHTPWPEGVHSIESLTELLTLLPSGAQSV